MDMEQDAKQNRYLVFVDDNFHYGEEKERYKLGEFGSCEEAIAACKRIIDEFMEKGFKEGISFKELWGGYMMFGEDPFIQSDDPKCNFSAWTYAKQRCVELIQSSRFK
jgi:hypothetical protein